MHIGIRVRRADAPGPLDIVTAIRRRLLSALQLVPFVSGAYFIVFLLDGLWPLWDDKRQALHDKVARTQVVEGKQPRKQAGRGLRGAPLGRLREPRSLGGRHNSLARLSVVGA